MRRNISQIGRVGADGWFYIDGDWYTRGIPPNVEFADDVYLDTAYSFAAFQSRVETAMTIGRSTGCYDRATFITGLSGRIHIGAFTMVNGSTIVAQELVTIGDHCMLAWEAW